MVIIVNNSNLYYKLLIAKKEEFKRNEFNAIPKLGDQASKIPTKNYQS